jgi:hypothetical protein
MGEGTTRVVETNGGGSRVNALGEEISDVREELDDLVTELDRRRHALTNRTWPAARQAGALAVVAAAAWLIGPRLIASYWPRRSPRG